MNKVYMVYSFLKKGKKTIGEVTLPLKKEWMTDEEVEKEAREILGDKDDLKVIHIYYNRSGRECAN